MNHSTNLKPLVILLLLMTYFHVNNLYSQCLNNQKYVQVIINADQYADMDNTNWNVTTDAGTILASGTSNSYNFCVSNYECVYFNIYDDYGDGLGNGSYELKYDGFTVASGSNFGTSLTVELGGCSAGVSCVTPITLNGDGTYVTNGPDQWYSYTPSISGYHAISTCNMNSCNTRIYGYENCTGIITSENQEQTVFFNNDYCNTQSEVNVILTAGVEYFIRIGDTDMDCANTNIQWTINFQNLASGCTDPVACNYNPAASSDDGTCLYYEGGECTDGPDLKILQDVLEATLITDELTNDDNCYVAEGCINGYGVRQIIRFTTHIKNIGNRDYYIGAPPANTSISTDQWEYDQCHNHWHYEGYGEYLLFDDNGAEIPIGFKNGFCVLDLECSDGGTAKYTCSDQGISAQCGDFYSRNLDCQWIDVTDVPDGDYTLVVRVNWDQSADALGRIETDFTNNWAQVCFNLSRNDTGHLINIISDCPAPIDCFSVPFGTAVEDCTGTCGGNAVTGDINANNVLTNDDVIAYNNAIINENIAATDCNDVAADGELNILDAVLVARCVNDANGSGDGHNHAHCDFPTVAINNNTQSACFSIGNLNTSQKYFDLLIENPNAHVTAYNIDLNGVAISSLTNLESGYTTDLKYDNGGEIVSVSYNLDNIARYNTPTPILRVYYSSASTICLNQVIDVVNEYHELISSCIDGTCLTIPNCTDNDNDGVCAADDCNDNNPNLPATPGTSCNDNNSTTTNDVIQSDGCTCQGTPPVNNSCVADYTVSGSSVTISGLTNPISAVKIIYPDYTTYWECNTWDTGCNSTEIVNNIPDGNYIISLNTYDAGWGSICNIFETFTIGGPVCTDNDNDGVCVADDCNDNNPSIPATPGSSCNDGNPNTTNDVILSDGCTCQGIDPSCTDNDNDGVCVADDCDDNNAALPATPGSTCNDGNSNTTNDVILSDGCTCQGTPPVNNNCVAEYTVSGSSVTISGLTNPISAVKIIYPDFTTYWECNSWDTGCNATEIINNIPDGEYYISLNTYDAGWGSICNIFEGITIGGSGCIDNDNDGICAGVDCNDNDATLPAIVGSSCNDNNSNTSNDVIQSDGCTCQGTPITNCTDNDNDGFCVEDDCNDNDASIPTTVGSSCNDNNANTSNDVIQSDGCTCQGTPTSTGCNATYTTGPGSVTFSNLTDPVLAIKIIDNNNNTVWECNSWATACNTTEIIENLSAGAYAISLNTYDAGWNSICNIYEVVNITAGNCDDSDNDGTCDSSDCAPTNASLPAAPGTPCNDFDANTENDVIQSDGCTCAGTAPSNCSANYTVNGNSVTINNLTDPINAVKIINLDYSTYWECNTWDIACDASEVINNIPSGNYYISLNTYDSGWNVICNIFEAISISQTVAPLISSIDDVAIHYDFNLYPNPVNDILTVEFSDQNEKLVTYELLSIEGVSIVQNKVDIDRNNNKFQIATELLQNGYYLLKIQIGDKIKTKPIIKLK